MTDQPPAKRPEEPVPPAAKGEDGRADQPRGRSRRLVLGVAALALVGIGLAVVLFVTAARTDTEAARDVADRFAAATQRAAESNGRSVDPADFEPLVCAADLGFVRRDVTDQPVEDGAPPPAFHVTVKDLRIDGDRGTVVLAAEISMPDGQKQGGDESFDLVRENSEWKVCGLQRDGG